MKVRAMMPVRFKRFWRELHGRDFTLLDVGCGNRSPTQTRKWFPRCRYSGLDKERYEIDEGNLSVMESFYRIDLQSDSLSSVPDRAFDVVLFSHVIEHLTSGLEVLAALTDKVAPGGRLYAEFPSKRSLRLPSMKGTLNFHDDPTHVRLYTVAEVRRVLESRGMEIVAAGRRRDLAHILLCPVHLVYNLVKSRRVSAAALWDLLGFADYVYAVSPR